MKQIIEDLYDLTKVYTTAELILLSKYILFYINLIFVVVKSLLDLVQRVRPPLYGGIDAA